MARCYSKSRLTHVDPDSRMSRPLEMDISNKYNSASVEMKRKALHMSHIEITFSLLFFCFKSLLVSHHSNHLNHIFAVTLWCVFLSTHWRVCVCVFLDGSSVGWSTVCSRFVSSVLSPWPCAARSSKVKCFSLMLGLISHLLKNVKWRKVWTLYFFLARIQLTLEGDLQLREV